MTPNNNNNNDCNDMNNHGQLIGILLACDVLTVLCLLAVLYKLVTP